MVKPTLKPEPEKEKKEDDLKDDKLKEWGILPATLVLDEETEKAKDKKDAEAALSEYDNLETDVDEARPTIVKCCACFAVFTIILIVTCTIGSFIYFHYGNSEHKWKGWCSVKYNEDDNHSGERGGNGYYGHHHGGRSSSEERRGGHHNGLQPHPSGPPGGRQCGFDSEVDLDNNYERINRPEEETPGEQCERLTILHDYNVNISAYRLLKSEICYINYIDEEILMDPQQFWTNMRDPEYLNQWFSELQLTYRAVLPTLPTPLHEHENGKYGEYLDGPKDYLCQGAESYWIEKIPEEELEEFLALVDQIMSELLALAEQYDQQQQQPIPEYPYGGNGGEDGFPWGDGEGFGEGQDWPGMPGYGGHHGGHHDGHHSGRHGGGHHDGHHGGGPDLRRRRRDAGWFGKFGEQQKEIAKKGKEAKQFMATAFNHIKEPCEVEGQPMLCNIQVLPSREQLEEKAKELQLPSGITGRMGKKHH